MSTIVTVLIFEAFCFVRDLILDPIIEFTKDFIVKKAHNLLEIKGNNHETNHS